ncbi:hypothetical protein GTY67_18945 [Streptomyces sp. SID8374]|uniref:hypothetical protein n=1 Tax=Streptomyces sp. SID8374 TaxID=2690354 RepID=UPI00136EAD14|nr:hypothetical protein [Streptomyces sp. SID8374]MYX15438.1 hypothetical protein [Streptomyces sp. SID8374]
MDHNAVAIDLIRRTEKAVEQVARLAVDTGITFKVADVVDAVERDLPANYPGPPADGGSTRRDMIASMANNILTGEMYEDPA